MRTTGILAVVGAVIVMSVAQVRAAATADSSTWAGKYECDAKPADDGWNNGNPTAPNYVSAAGGILTIDSVDFGTSPWFNRTPPSLDLTTGTPPGATFEWRAKMIVAENNASIAPSLLGVAAADGSKVVIGITETQVFANGAWYAMDTTDDFHVYRVTMESSGYHLYIDGLHVLAGALDSGSANYIEFGDETGADDAEYQTDYIRWTDEGAFAPPVTFASDTWEHRYECDGYPDSFGWTLGVGSANSYASFGGGILTIDSIDFNQSPWYRFENPTLNLTSGSPPGVSLEWRVKMIESESAASAAACLCGITADDGAGSTKRGVIGLVEAQLLAPAAYAMDTTDKFHVYRLTMDASGYKLYLDGEAATVLSGAAGAGGNIFIEFGDETAGDDAEYENDYVRWTDGGAFAFPPKGTMIIIQ